MSDKTTLSDILTLNVSDSDPSESLWKEAFSFPSAPAGLLDDYKSPLPFLNVKITPISVLSGFVEGDGNVCGLAIFDTFTNAKVPNGESVSVL